MPGRNSLHANAWIVFDTPAALLLPQQQADGGCSLKTFLRLGLRVAETTGILLKWSCSSQCAGTAGPTGCKYLLGTMSLM
mmetsp:Transcript_35528/g.57185  ORF Transcript_35528/g.57185 Transcript_35528/m.57185 type:complete len:80 (-) Transcript_35528:20-259(-)